MSDKPKLSRSARPTRGAAQASAAKEDAAEGRGGATALARGARSACAGGGHRAEMWAYLTAFLSTLTALFAKGAARVRKGLVESARGMLFLVGAAWGALRWVLARAGERLHARTHMAEHPIRAPGASLHTSRTPRSLAPALGVAAAAGAVLVGAALALSGPVGAVKQAAQPSAVGEGGSGGITPQANTYVTFKLVPGIVESTVGGVTTYAKVTPLGRVHYPISDNGTPVVYLANGHFYTSEEAAAADDTTKEVHKVDVPVCTYRYDAYSQDEETDFHPYTFREYKLGDVTLVDGEGNLVDPAQLSGAADAEIEASWDPTRHTFTYVDTNTGTGERATTVRYPDRVQASTTLTVESMEAHKDADGNALAFWNPAGDFDDPDDDVLARKGYHINADYENWGSALNWSPIAFDGRDAFEAWMSDKNQGRAGDHTTFEVLFTNLDFDAIPQYNTNRYVYKDPDDGGYKVPDKLYLIWDPDTYDVTLDANGGTFEGAGSPTTKTVAKTYDKQTGAALSAPTWGRRRFKGWYTAREGGELVYEADATAITDDALYDYPAASRVLYAQWESPVSTWRVSRMPEDELQGEIPATERSLTDKSVRELGKRYMQVVYDTGVYWTANPTDANARVLLKTKAGATGAAAGTTPIAPLPTRTPTVVYKSGDGKFVTSTGTSTEDITRVMSGANKVFYFAGYADEAGTPEGAFKEGTKLLIAGEVENKQPSETAQTLGANVAYYPTSEITATMEPFTGARVLYDVWWWNENNPLLKLPTTIKPGYTPNGWEIVGTDKTVDPGDTTYVPTNTSGPVTLKALYTPNDNDITYSLVSPVLDEHGNPLPLKDGSGNNLTNANVPASFKSYKTDDGELELLNLASTSAPVSTWQMPEGYTFKGWKLSPTGEGEHSLSGDDLNKTYTTIPNGVYGSYQATPVWEGNIFKVTLKTENATTANYPESQEFYVRHGEAKLYTDAACTHEATPAAPSRVYQLELDDNTSGLKQQTGDNTIITKLKADMVSALGSNPKTITFNLTDKGYRTYSESTSTWGDKTLVSVDGSRLKATSNLADITEDTTVYANWTNTNPITLPMGSDYNLSLYDFEGWSKSGEGEVVSQSYEPTGTTSSVKLLGTWHDDSQVATYAGLEGTGAHGEALVGKAFWKNGNDNPNPVYFKGTLTTQEKPQRNGYTFLGWIVTDTSQTPPVQIGERTAANDVVSVTTNAATITLTADWEASAGKVTLDPRNEDATTKGSLNVKPITDAGYSTEGAPTGAYTKANGYTTGTAQDLPKPTLPGYTFTGWELKPGDGGRVVNASGQEVGSYTGTTIPVGCYGPISATAVWTPKTYGVSVVPNGATNATGVTYTSPVTRNDATFDASYSFTNESGGTPFTQRKVSVTYHHNTGLRAIDDEFDTSHNGQYIDRAFQGYKINGAGSAVTLPHKVATASTITSPDTATSLTLTAQWSDASIASQIDPNLLTEVDGYRFAGWVTSQADAQTLVNNFKGQVAGYETVEKVKEHTLNKPGIESSALMVSSVAEDNSLDLWGVWLNVRGIDYLFHTEPAYAAGDPSQEVSDSKIKWYDADTMQQIDNPPFERIVGSTDTKLPIPEREGYTFLGWSTSEVDGQGKLIHDSDHPNKNVSISSAYDADVTATSHWVLDLLGPTVGPGDEPGKLTVRVANLPARSLAVVKVSPADGAGGGPDAAMFDGKYLYEQTVRNPGSDTGTGEVTLTGLPTGKFKLEVLTVTPWGTTSVGTPQNITVAKNDNGTVLAANDTNPSLRDVVSFAPTASGAPSYAASSAVHNVLAGDA